VAANKPGVIDSNAKHESRAEKTVEEKQHPTQANPTSVLQRMNETLVLGHACQ